MISEIEESLYTIYSGLSDIKSERDRLVVQLDEQLKQESSLKQLLLSSKEAQSILQTVARETQSEIEDHISTVVTMALSAVEVDDVSVPKPPEFVARAVERRDSTEFDLLFKEEGVEQYPLLCSGFGYVDIADYALRVDFILLELEYSKSNVRKVLILDEPFRNADPKLQFKISEMLHMVSDDLGFQQIIVSHAEGVNVDADKIFYVEKQGNICTIEELSQKA